MSESTNLKLFQEIVHIYENYSSQVAWSGAPEDLYTPIAYIMHQEGKKLRPAALLMIYNLWKDDLGKALGAAYGLELFHNFTLVHDDIMDDSTIRRGRETVYRKFGTNQAILSGDAMLIEACRLVYQSQLESGIKGNLDLFLKTAMDVCEGQSLDMSFEKMEKVILSEYLNMIRLKTSVLLGCAFQMGAELAHQSQEVCEKLYELGTTLGVGFQIHDDWLDFYGDQQLTGKVKGGDILKKKKSALILTALDSMEEEKRQVLLKEYHEDHPEKIELIESRFSQLGIKEKVNEMYLAYKKRCFEMIENLPLNPLQKSRLNEFVILVLERTN
ncbi:MAG: polyprenyl synthetase family protein [Saprospiraceae bacterium]|nr:polyprenyl synthetase family protein [Candidatus Vicinibacter affinis]MBP6173168.1 polyprenyl synthetase family protein [Saprospiraceae bacterium]MBP6521549.1 polyprenyl synthetase family protein [Saprospiraceae bacterium]